MLDNSEYSLVKDEYETDPENMGYGSMFVDGKIAYQSVLNAMLDRPQVPNPAIPKRLKMPTSIEVWRMLQLPDKQVIEDTFIPRVRAALDARDLAEMAEQIEYAVDRGWISLTAKAAIQARLDSSNPDNLEDDPSAPKTVRAKSRLDTILNRNVDSVTVDQLKEALLNG